MAARPRHGDGQKSRPARSGGHTLPTRGTTPTPRAAPFIAWHDEVLAQFAAGARTAESVSLDVFDTLLVRFFGRRGVGRTRCPEGGRDVRVWAGGSRAARAVVIQRPSLTHREFSGLFWINGAVSLGLAAGGRVLWQADTTALAMLAAGCALAMVPGGVWPGGSAELGVALAASYAATAAVLGCLPRGNRMLRDLWRLRSTLRAEPIKP